MIFVSTQGFGDVVKAVEGLKDGTPRATMRALNRAIAAAQTVMVRSVAGDIGMKQADVRKALTVTDAKPSRLVATLSGQHPTPAFLGVVPGNRLSRIGRIPLIAFKAKGREPSRGKGKGVSYRLPGSSNSNVATAFITTLKSGHRGVFVREGKKRLPIHELFGPSIGHVFLKYRHDAQARAEEIFVSRFEHEMSGAWNGTPVPAEPVPSDASAGA